MRLSKNDINIIKKTSNELYGDARIWLFGSRVDDNKKGGDIDLFIESLNDSSLKTQIAFCTKLQKAGIERKVDLVVKSSQSKDKLIFNIAKKEGILL